MFNVNNRNTRTKYEMCSKLTKRHQNDVFIVKFGYMPHLALVVSIVIFEQF